MRATSRCRLLRRVAGRGPGDDLVEGRTLLIRDAAADSRRSEHARRAAAAGFGCAVVTCLPVGAATVGTLTVYANVPDGVSEAGARLTTEFARYASVVLSNFARYADALLLAEQLREAMASRAVIEQAKGMLMITQRCDAGEAFGFLVHASQESGRKLREVAADFVTAESAPAESAPAESALAESALAESAPAEPPPDAPRPGMRSRAVGRRRSSSGAPGRTGGARRR